MHISKKLSKMIWLYIMQRCERITLEGSSRNNPKFCILDFLLIIMIPIIMVMIKEMSPFQMYKNTLWSRLKKRLI